MKQGNQNEVKSGHVKSGDIRDLKGTVEREKAAIGVFLTLEELSKPMNDEAVSAGYYQQEGFERMSGRDNLGYKYPRIQILTIDDLLHKRKRLEIPSKHETFKEAQKVQQQVDVGIPELPMEY
jgi:site-specific DNA-methyltransferase (adenine-specific)